jgi:hypothetical protein
VSGKRGTCQSEMEETKDTDDYDEAMGEFLIAIFDDVRRAERELKKDDSPFTRRAYVRTMFSSVEGFAFTMKKIALGKPNLFAPGELALLREEEYHLTTSGEVRVRRRFLRTAENLRFAFAAFMKFHGAPSVLPTDEGWSAFVAAIEVRHRITHPKRLEDLEIGDREIETIRRAAHWLAVNVLMSVMQAMSPGAAMLVGLFLVAWGLVNASPRTQSSVPETD